MNRQEKIRLSLLFTTLLLLGTVLHLQYKSQVAYKHKSLAASTNFNVTNKAPLTINDLSHLRNVNYDSALKAYNASAPSTGNPQLNMDQLKSLVSSLLGGAAPSCLGSVGNIQVSHGLCTPPGPGKWTGQPDLPGTDLRPCPVTGVQGGSIVAVCLSGCCRAVSASGAQGALSGFTSQQLQSMGILAQMLPQFLQQLMGQDSGSSGGYYYDPNNYTNTQDSDVSIIDSGENTVSNLNYDNFDTYSSYMNEDGYDMYSSVSDGAGTELAYNNTQSPEDVIETMLIKEEKSQEEAKQPVRQAEVTRPYAEQAQNQAIEDEIENINRQDDNLIFYTFQNIGDDKAYDPRVEDLRDPTKSKVKQYSRKTIEIEEPAVEKAWWEKLLDWLLGLN